MRRSFTAPQDTLIIFDWDDTLLCTSAINASTWDFAQLQQLEKAAESCLRAAMKLGRVMVVTNGNGTWVSQSSYSYLPRLVSTLADIEVVSARWQYESYFPGDPFAWKREAFRDILATIHQPKMRGVQERTNLIVLGDSPAELEAAHYAARAVGSSNVLVKTVKFKEQPAVAQLLGQLRRTTQELQQLVDCDSSSSKMLECCTQHAMHVEAGAEDWEFRDCKSWDNQFSLAQAFFNLSDIDEDLANLELPKWMVQAGAKLSCWHNPLLQVN